MGDAGDWLSFRNLLEDKRPERDLSCWAYFAEKGYGSQKKGPDHVGAIVFAVRTVSRSSFERQK
jgi:hypothetical protein